MFFLGYRIFESEGSARQVIAIERCLIRILRDFVEPSPGKQPLPLNHEQMVVARKILDDQNDGAADNADRGWKYLAMGVFFRDRVVREILDCEVADCAFLVCYTHGDSEMEIVLACMMMVAGVMLFPVQHAHVRKLLPLWHKGLPYPRSGLSKVPEGFENAGQAQLAAALDHYQAGFPRDFRSPSCFNCGKIASDLGTELLACGSCGMAWWCNQECKAKYTERVVKNFPADAKRNGCKKEHE